MTFKLWVTLGALLVAATGAQAQQGDRTPASADPADPTVAVPAPVYASALADHAPAAQAGGPSPDRSWRAANAAVGGAAAQAPHAGHAGHQAQAPASAPAPARPAPQRAEPAARPGHQHQQHRGEARQ